MRDGPWKLVVQHPRAKPGTFENPRVELYHLVDDLGEENDLAQKHPGRAGRMLEAIQTWFEAVTRDATPQPGGWLNHQAP